MTDPIEARLTAIEEKQDRLLNSFTEFRVKDFASVRERISALEVKAGLIGLIAGLVGAWIKSAL